MHNHNTPDADLIKSTQRQLEAASALRQHIIDLLLKERCTVDTLYIATAMLAVDMGHDRDGAGTNAAKEIQRLQDYSRRALYTYQQMVHHGMALHVPAAGADEVLQ